MLWSNFTFLPLAAVFALGWWTQHRLARSAERRAADWEKLSREQDVTVDNLRMALKTQGEALEGLMRATDGWVIKTELQA